MRKEFNIPDKCEYCGKVNFNALPENTQNYIVTTYSCDSSGKTWGDTTNV